MIVKSSQWPIAAEISAAAYHVGDRPGEVPEDLRREAFLLLDEGVRSISAQTLLRLGAAQTLIWPHNQFGDDVVHRRLLKVHLGIRRRLGRSGLRELLDG